MDRGCGPPVLHKINKPSVYRVNTVRGWQSKDKRKSRYDLTSPEAKDALTSANSYHVN